METNGDDSLKRKLDDELDEESSKKIKQESTDSGSGIPGESSEKMKQPDVSGEDNKEWQQGCPGEGSSALKFLAYKDVPYEEQLRRKVDEVETCFKTFHTSFPKQYPELSEWHKNQLMKWFKIENIKASPKIEGYRNKCELTIGFNPEIGRLGAGVRTSEIESEQVQINTTDDSFIHLPKHMIQLAQEFSNFLNPYNDNKETCPFVYLYIRSNTKDEMMLMVIVRAENDTSEDFKGYKESVVRFFTEESSLKDQIKSIYLQARPAGSTKKAFELPFSHAAGELHLTEVMHGVNVHVTPSLFFGINTYAAEIIYQQVVELADCRKKKTLVIDLFCGSGILSMILAQKARQVIAIDPSKWNIKQAKAMAYNNNIKNIQFLIGKPEDALSQAWSQIVQAEEVIIICDPPANSKPRFYIDAIGDMNNLTKIIYMNSNAKSNVVKNLMSLTEAALLPVRVIPVDIAPYTVRLEMVILCKKFDPCQISRSLDAVPPPSLLEMGRNNIVGGGGRWGGMGSDGYYFGEMDDIERRAYAMGMSKGFGSRGNFYDDYNYQGGPPRGGGYGGYGGFGNGFGRNGGGGGGWGGRSGGRY